jgi:hypothetical protein
MGLLVCAAESRGIMKGIGAGQQVPGNHGNEIAHEMHVGRVPQHVGEQDLPLLKGPAPVAFLSPRRPLIPLCSLKIRARLALRPSWQVARGEHSVILTSHR